MKIWKLHKKWLDGKLQNCFVRRCCTNDALTKIQISRKFYDGIFLRHSDIIQKLRKRQI